MIGAADFASSEPMRILFITTGLRMGGAEQQVAALAREFVALGHQVGLISLTPDCEVSMPAAVERLMLDMRKTPLSMLRALLAARRFVQRWQPDIVQAHMFHANLFSRMLSRIAELPPLVCTAHSYSEGGRLRMLAYRLTDKWCTLTTHVSEGSRAHMIEEKAVSADRIVVMYNGIDTEKFKPDAALREQARHALGIGADVRLLLNIGRLVPEKAQATLLEAFHLLRPTHPVRLLIAGDGPERAPLQARIDKLGLQDRVTLLGMRQDTPALHNAADLFVLSSRVEGMPLVLGEALSCGRPVVATSAPGVAELLGRAETIVPVGDVPALATAITAALERGPGGSADEAARRQSIVDRYGIQAAALRWLDLYRQVRLHPSHPASAASTGPCAGA